MVANKLYSGLIFSLVLLAASCGQKPQGAPMGGPVEVTTMVVKKESVSVTDQYPGIVVPLQEVELRAEVGGTITGIFFKDGQKVSKGQKLYEIDRTNYQAAFNAAKANVQVAKANVDRTGKDAERFKTLASKDAVAGQKLDYALTDYSNAQSQLALAEANLSTAEANLRRSLIVAPFNGVIGISSVKPGAFVSPGSTLLNKVSTVDPITVDIAVNQREIARFVQLQNDPKKTLADSIFKVVYDQNAYAIPGKIEIIDRAVNPGTGSITIRLSFANPNSELVAGMNCNVLVKNVYADQKIVIPHRAVNEQLGKFSVYVVKDNKVEQRLVETGASSGSNVVILSGVEDGETIVLDGLMKLRHGAEITVAQPANAESK